MQAFLEDPAGVRLPEDMEAGKANTRDDYQQQHKMDVLVEVRYPAPEPVTEQSDSGAPNHSAEYVIKHKPTPWHFAYAGDHRCECPDDGDKTCEDNSLSTMLFIKFFGTFDMFVLE